MNPSVSILIPVYNAGEYLAQCIDSVLRQTYDNLQVVLIDDGSKDCSWNICCKYKEIDKRIEVYHQDNQGVANTRNNLLERVNGDYVLFVDADDWIEPEMVESLLVLALKMNADIVNCGYVVNNDVCEKGKEEFNVWTKDEAVRQFLRHKIFRGSLWNKLLKTEMLCNSKFLHGISFGEDALFFWHVLQNVNTVVLTNQQFYHYRMVDTSLAHSDFGPKKMSAYVVWERITNEAEQRWPQFADIAKARFCIEMILLLRCAAQSQHLYDELVKQLQTIIRAYSKFVVKVGLSSWRMILYGRIGVTSYATLRLIEKWIH